MNPKIYFAVIATIVFSVFLLGSAQAAGSYDFTCQTQITVIEQFDGEVKYSCMVKNTGDTYLELMYEVRPEQNPIDPNVAVGFHPQPSNLYLEAGESQPIAGFEVPPRVPAGKTEHSYSRTFTVKPAGASAGSVPQKSITVTTVVKSEPPKDEARISGKIVDADSGQSIGNANISFRYKRFERRSMGRDGRYSAQVPSLPFLMQVESPGYELYGANISAPHGEVAKDISLKRADKSGAYSLIKQPRIESGAWEGVWRAAVSPDGRYVAFGTGGLRTGNGTEAYVYLFSTQGEEILKIKTPDEVRGIDISPDGSLVAVSLGDGRSSLTGSAFEKVLVYKKSGELLWKKFTNEEVYFEIRFSNDGKYVAVGDRAGYVYLLDANTGAEIWKKFTRGQVRAVRFYDDNSHVLVASGDDHVHLFDIAGNEKWKTYVHSWSYGFVAATPGNDYSAAGGHVSYLHLLDRNGKDLWAYEGDGGFRWAEIGSQAAYVVGGSRSELVFLDGAGNVVWKGNDAVSGAVTNDKKYIISGNQKGELELRNTKGTILWAHRTGEMEPGKDVRLAYVSDDASLIVGAIKNGQLYFFKGGITQSTVKATPPAGQSATPAPIGAPASQPKPPETTGIAPQKPPIEQVRPSAEPMPVVPEPSRTIEVPPRAPSAQGLVVPYIDRMPGPLAGVQPRDTIGTMMRGFVMNGSETGSAELVVDGAEVRGWDPATQDAVRGHLEENDAKNDANDFGLRVAMFAIENAGIHAISVKEAHEQGNDEFEVSVDYTARVKLFWLFNRDVDARLTAYPDGSFDEEYRAPWYVRWFSSGVEREDLKNIALQIKNKLAATLGGLPSSVK